MAAFPHPTSGVQITPSKSEDSQSVTVQNTPGKSKATGKIYSKVKKLSVGVISQAASRVQNTTIKKMRRVVIVQFKHSQFTY